MDAGRLLVLTPVYPPARGGIETLTEGIVARWDGPVCVVTLREPGSQDWDSQAGYPIRRAGNQPRGGRRSLARLSWLATRHARGWAPDVVLSMHVRCGWAAHAIAGLTGARWVQYYHAKEVPTWPVASRHSRHWADAGIAVSQYTAALVADPTGRVQVIPPGIPDAGRPAAAPPRARGLAVPAAPPDRLSSRGPTILTVSRISDAYKGHDVMLAAMPLIMNAVPGVRWLIAGDGPLRPGLESQVRRAGLGRSVRFLGALSDADRDHVLATSDIFALPSRSSADGRCGEGFGIVYTEAAAAGLPVVAGDRGGAVDAVRNGETGVLVDATDPGDVAAAVIRLLTDEPLRARMSASARAWSEGFTWSAVFPRIRSVLTASRLPAPECRS